jgi:hypothetical protein
MWKEGKEGLPPLAWSLLFKGECNNNREGQVSIVVFHLLSFRKCSHATQRREFPSSTTFLTVVGE